MSKYQALQNAIALFLPGGADAPILHCTTEVNEKGFQALLGRKLKSRPLPAAVWIAAFALMAVSVASIIAFAQTGASTFCAFVPVFVVLFFIRTTFVSVGEAGLDFYFAESARGSKYAVYDKISLPYDKVTGVRVRAGRFNTSLTFAFTAEGKTYKIKTTVPNKDKKMKEQAENLKYLLEALEKMPL